MPNIFFISILLFIILAILNFFLVKLNFCIHKINQDEKHKKFVQKKNSKIPLSGSIFFSLIILLFFDDYNYINTILILLIFFIGFCSDIKFLNSPKIRLLFQILICLIFVYLNKDLHVETRVDIIDRLLENNLVNLFFITFCLLVIINGYNFIDGTNLLCSLNLFIVLIFLKLLHIEYNLEFTELNYLIIGLFFFMILNFFGLNFLGDGGAYGVALLVGYISIKTFTYIPNISPYFIVNLLWYPALENLYSIIRRNIDKKEKFVPDNNHLHHLIFVFILKKTKFKKNYLQNSSTGILINLYLLLTLVLAFQLYSYTKYQILITILNTFVYLLIFKLMKKNNR